MIKKAISFLILLISIFCIVASFQADHFTVSRSATYSASAESLFAKVNNLHEWNTWSPWAKIDPNAKATFEGPIEGEGAIMKWVSDNDEVGTGSMTITKSIPNEKVNFDLAFISPFKGTSKADFTFQSEGNTTKVTWSMYGEKNFISKAMGLIFDCDKMVGGQFEKGLANLKPLVESSN